MNLVPKTWSPVEDIRKEMSDLFNRWMPALSPRREEVGLWEPFQSFAAIPSLDIEETDNEYLVHAEMPGLQKDEFNVEINNDNLILRGEKKRECEQNDKSYHHRECTYGSFYRNVRLPGEVLADQATAEYKNGVLNIHLPKSAESKSKRITVNIG